MKSGEAIAAAFILGLSIFGTAAFVVDQTRPEPEVPPEPPSTFAVPIYQQIVPIRPYSGPPHFHDGEETIDRTPIIQRPIIGTGPESSTWYRDYLRRRNERHEQQMKELQEKANEGLRKPPNPYKATDVAGCGCAVSLFTGVRLIY